MDSINNPDVGWAIRRFIDVKSRHDAVPLDSPRAEELLWRPAADLWETACGKITSSDILQTLANRVLIT